MTHALLENRDAYRSVFSEDGEALFIFLLGNTKDQANRHAIALAQESVERLNGVRIVIVYPGRLGGGQAQQHDGREIPGVHVISGIPDPVVEGMLSVADGVVVFDHAAFEHLQALESLPVPRIVERSLFREGQEVAPGTEFFDSAADSTLRKALMRCLSPAGNARLESQDAGKHVKKAEASGRRPFHAPQAREFVLYNNWGIGDELLLSAVAREIVRTQPDCRVSIRSRFGFRFPSYVSREEPSSDAVSVETIYQNPVLYGPDRHSPFPGHLVQQMLDKFYVDTQVSVEAKDVRPELALPPDFGRTRVPWIVTLHARPNPRLPSKDWGIGRWRRLCELLKHEGLRIRQVGRLDDPLLPHAEDLRGVRPRDLRDLMGQTGVVVSLVGLLMHVAEATRTPAVVIYGGREHPSIDGYPDQIHLASGPLPCKGRWGCHLAPDTNCPNDMKCMEELTPKRVAREVTAAIDSRYVGVST